MYLSYFAGSVDKSLNTKAAVMTVMEKEIWQEIQMATQNPAFNVWHAYLCSCFSGSHTLRLTTYNTYELFSLC